MRIKILIVLLFTMIASPTFAGSSNFYALDGSYQGTMQSAGQNNNFIYGCNDEYVGGKAKAGNTTFFHGSDGPYADSSKSMGNILTE